MTMPIALFSNFAGPDMIVIALIMLLLFGAKKLPELARGLGQSLNEFKKAREDVEHEFRQGQQDTQAREAQNRQPYNPSVAAVPAAQALTYNNPTALVASEQALQQQIAELQEKLRLAEEQSKGANQPVR